MTIPVTEDGAESAGAATQAMTIDRPRSRWPFLLALVGVVAGAGFLAYSVLNRDSSLTPTEAATEMIDALAAGDLLGAVAVLPPTERDAIAGPALSIIDELQRISVFDSSVDGDDSGAADSAGDGPISDLALTIVDPTFSVVDQSDDLVIVAVDHLGGSGPANLGQTVLSPILDQLGDIDTDLESDAETFAPGRFHLATVEEDGGWYVSPLHSYMEYGRQFEGTPFPAEPFVLAPGSASADAVLQDMADALVDGRFGRMIELLDPHEAEGLQRYAPTVFDLDSLGDEFRSNLETDDVQIDIAIGSTTGEDDRGTYVRVDSIAIDILVPDEVRFSYAVIDGCLKTQVENLTGNEFNEDVDVDVCADDAAAAGDSVESLEWPEGLRPPILDAYADDALTFGGVRVSEIDGTWYLSPWQTTWAWVEDLLRPLDADIVADTIDWAQDLSENPDRLEELSTELIENNEAVLTNPLGQLFALGTMGVTGGTFDDSFDDSFDEPFDQITYVSPDLLPPSDFTWQYSPSEAVDFGFAPRELEADVVGALETEGPPQRGDFFVYYSATEYVSEAAAADAFAIERDPTTGFTLIAEDQPPGSIIGYNDFGATYGLFRYENVIYRAAVFGDGTSPSDPAIPLIVNSLIALSSHAEQGN